MKYTKLAALMLVAGMASSCVGTHRFHLNNGHSLDSHGMYTDLGDTYEVPKRGGKKSTLNKRHVVEIEHRGKTVPWPAYWNKNHGFVRNAATFPLEVVIGTPLAMLGKFGDFLF